MNLFVKFKHVTRSPKNGLADSMPIMLLEILKRLLNLANGLANGNKRLRE